MTTNQKNNIMKTLLAIIVLILFTTSTFASGIKTRMRPQDRLIVETFIDLWQNKPADIKSASLDRGVNISWFYDYPIAMSNFSVATGFNFTSHNFYTKSHLYTREGVTEKFDFVKIADGIEVNKSKISLNYIGIPVEIRYFVRSLPQSLRIHAGFKAGYLVSGYNKYSGQDLAGNNFDVKFREYKLGNVNDFFYGITARIGYGRINVYGFMPLNKVFFDNSVEEMVPISLGLSLILF
jgi:hypothetical protein